MRAPGATVVAAIVLLLAVAGCDGPSRPKGAATSRAAASRSSARSSARPSARPRVRRPRRVSIASVLRVRATGGVVLERSIPSSGAFRPRPAFVYVPPALRRSAHRHVPVLEMLHGTPGGPADWFTLGDLRASADAFAARHGGLAPLIVAPDLNGAPSADSQCIRTAAGADVARYLTVDVVSWVRRNYRSAVGTSRWWVAGLSEGGLCSAVLALRHPTLYAAFGDMSGLLSPIVNHLTPAASDRQLFGSSAAAKREHEPVWLLQHGLHATLRAWFACGAADGKVLPAQKAIVTAARRAGVPTHAQVQPGKHAWSVWAPALRDLLPWLWSSRPS